MKRLFATLLIFTAILPSVFSPHIARAALDVEEVANASGECISVGLTTWLAGQAASALKTTGSVANAALSVPISNFIIENSTAVTEANASNVEPWYTCAGYAAGELVLEQLTNQTIAWIKGGFNGSPSYSIDTHKLFTDLTEMVAGGLAQDIRDLNACDFRVNYKNDLANWVETSGNERAKFREQAQCPFQDKFNFTASELYGDFQKGGWKFFETTLNDSGNPFGLAVMTAKELTRAQEQEIRIQEQRLSWGGGFLDIIDEKKCKYPEGITKEMVEEMAKSGNSAAAVSYKRSYCPVTTPGKLIETKLSEALGVKMDRLKLADNMSKIVAALINKLSDDAIKSVFQ